MTDPFLRSTALLFVLLNPFLLSIYLLDLIRTLDAGTFRRVMVRATAIAAVAFAVCALTGDAIFRDVLQVRFASFLIFGGLIFLLIGIRFVMQGPSSLTQLRGAPEHMAGSVAMPFMIGPGTVSASVLAGARLPAYRAVIAITAAMAMVVVSMLIAKWVYDRVAARNAILTERYVEIVGRISALIIGTIAVEMVLQGADLWLNRV